NVNNPELEEISEHKIPDVVLVKKVYAQKSVRNRRRKWRLRHMDGLHGTKSLCSDNPEMTDFLEDIEEDVELRKHINIYKDPKKLSIPVDQDEDDTEIPGVSLAEMLESFSLNPAAPSTSKDTNDEAMKD
ncbi:60S ribosomal export protein NMD3, partial [Caligus rogercresseyi]